MLLLVQIFVENVDYWIKPDRVGKSAGYKPKPNVDLRHICDHVALRIFVVLVVGVDAVFNVIGPAIRNHGIKHLVDRNHHVDFHDDP